MKLKNIIKIQKLFFLLPIFLICIILFKFSHNNIDIPVSSNSINWDNWSIDNTNNKNYIKWVDFTPTYEVLTQTSKLDIDSHINNESIKFNWIELIGYLACKYGGDFKKFNQKDLDALVKELRSGKTIENLSSKYKHYSYYYEAYDAVLHEFIGNFEIEITDESGNKSYTKKYGIKAYLPIASNYSFNHYDDFGNSRSYGYKRVHLGNDLMGSIGTPIIAVESGTVEVLGWNQYGGWRIGIRSFDKKRYYYYAHLRKDRPYAENLQEGQIVTAGDVIGYLGMTRIQHKGKCKQY